jgi:hypothetical protein
VNGIRREFAVEVFSATSGRWYSFGKATRSEEQVAELQARYPNWTIRALPVERTETVFSIEERVRLARPVPREWRERMLADLRARRERS